MAIKPSLLTLAKSGHFGGAHFGMNQDEVIKLLGKPDYTGGGSRRHADNLWKYGDIELGFIVPELTLFHIAITFWGEDRLPEQGNNLSYDPWIIKGGLDIQTFTKACAEHDIQHKELIPPWNEGCREFTTLFDNNETGGMHLLFQDEKEYDEQALGLYKFVATATVMEPKT